MLLTFLLATCAFGLSLLLTPLLRDLARRRRWFDQPDNRRKVHQVPVPRIGGVAILLAYAASLGLLLLTADLGGFHVGPLLTLAWRMLPAIIVIFATGLVDDLSGLSPRQKLAGQSLAGLLVCLGDIQIRSLAGIPLSPYVGVPLTILWLVGCANAFNLIDGVDGLASGIGLIASLTMLAVGVVHGDSRLIMATAPLAGALLGFLIFNFNPASIFLGDCGSLWLGFMLGICAVIWSQKPATGPGALAPLIALFIPLLDLGISTLRRFLRRDPIFRADRDHIHHRLLDRGLPQRRVTLVLFAASALAACFALLECVAASRVGGLGIVLFSTVSWVGIQELRYQEFGLAARLFWRNDVRRKVKSYLLLRRCEESLRLASNAEECWQAILALSLELGFHSAALRLSRRNYHEQTSRSLERCWMLHIPLSESEYVGFMCPLELSRDTKIIAPLAELLHRALSIKAEEFNSGIIIAPKTPAPATAARPALTPYEVGGVPHL